MPLTSENIAILVPVFRAKEAELAKFIDQLARLGSKPFVFFAYEDNSCTFDFVKFIIRAAEKIKLQYEVKTFSGNKGLGYALNKSLIEIKHTFVMRHDIGDDILENRFSVVENTISKFPNFDILYTQAIVKRCGLENISKCPTTVRALSHAFVTRNPIIHPTVVFRRSAIINIGNYNSTLRYCEDLDLWLRALHNNLRFYAVNVATVRYFAPINLRSSENWKQNLLVRINNLGSPSYFISILGIINIAMFNLVPNFLKSALYDYFKK